MPFFQEWTPVASLRPLLSHGLAMTYGLYILAYPPRNRYLAFLLLCVPTLYAFRYHLSLTPWYPVNDTFGRMLYIWLAYMSYACLLVRVTPNIGHRAGWRERLPWAGKTLYTRHLGEYYTPPSAHRAIGKGKDEEQAVQPASEKTILRRRREAQHHLNRLEFCLRHLAKAVIFIAFNRVYDTYIVPPTTYPPASFIRRLPASLTVDELRLRAMMTWDICIGDMLYFESVYSVFAVLWVGIFRLDSASEWSLSLFGNLTDCSSVRAYWGTYWHDFINASFTAHVKLITRSALRMRKSAARRLVENAVVFGMSGLVHLLVRYVQTEGRGEIWTVAAWYGAQILPVVVEGVLQSFWSRSGLQGRLRVRLGEVVVVRLESAAGHAWVVCWMFWSVPKYLLTRHAWELENLQRRYPELFSSRENTSRFDIGGLE
jgi:hypothetical protein